MLSLMCSITSLLSFHSQDNNTHLLSNYFFYGLADSFTYLHVSFIIDNFQPIISRLLDSVFNILLLTTQDNKEEDKEEDGIKDDSNIVYATFMSILTHLLRSNPSKEQRSQASSNILNFLHKHIMSDVSSFVYQNIKSRQISSVLLKNIICGLNEDVIIIKYRHWLQASLSCIGDYDEIVRTQCMLAFRKLVPLATLVQSQKGASNVSGIPSSSGLIETSTEAEEEGQGEDRRGSITNLVDCILSRTCPPNIIENISDRHIIEYLRVHTNLFPKDILSPGEVLITAATAASTSASTSSSMSLRDYQWAGVTWITELFRCGLGALLADDMGLGKSIQALTSLAVHRVSEGFQTFPSLIVCPASLKLHWSQEIPKFFPSHILNAKVLGQTNWSKANSSKESQAAVDMFTSADVVIVSYEALRSGFLEVFGDRIWEVVILDEAHVIKNPATQTAKCVFKIKAKRRIALTGTPVQNQVQDLWSLMNFIIPDFLGGYKTFQGTVMKPISKSMSVQNSIKANVDTSSKETSEKKNQLFHKSIDIATEGLDILHRLHKQILPFILRRTKEEVARELPTKTVINIFCPLTALQAQYYTAFQKGLKISDASLELELQATLKLNTGSTSAASTESLGSSTSAIHPLKAFKYLQLLCVHPYLVISSDHKHYKQRILNETNVSGKMTQLARLLVDSMVIKRNECIDLESLYVGDSGKIIREYDDQIIPAEGDDGDGVSDRIFLGGQSAGMDRREDDESAKEDSDADSDNEDGCGGSNEEEREEDEEEESLSEGLLNIKPKERNTFFSSSSSSSSSKTTVKTSRKAQASTAKHKPQSKEAQSKSKPKPAAPPTTGLSRKKQIISNLSSKSKRKKDSSTDATDISQNSKPSVSTVDTGNLTASMSMNSALQVATIGNDSLHPCLIFAQHQMTLDLIETCVLKKYFPSVKYAKLDGRVPSNQRAKIIFDFNTQNHDALALANCPSNENSVIPRLPKIAFTGNSSHLPISEAGKEVAAENIPRILLMTTRACGLGVNLTSADTVIFVEHDFNPFVDLQAMDRAHRIGQMRPVTIYRLLAESTIEARISYLQDFKKTIAEEIIGGNKSDEGKESESSSMGDMLLQSILVNKGESACRRNIRSNTDVRSDDNFAFENQGEYESLDVDAFIKSIGM